MEMDSAHPATTPSADKASSDATPAASLCPPSASPQFQTGRVRTRLVHAIDILTLLQQLYFQSDLKVIVLHTFTFRRVPPWNGGFADGRQSCWSSWQCWMLSLSRFTSFVVEFYGIAVQLCPCNKPSRCGIWF
ncbi:uncharacterized protein [Aegilops tauschii subsp. strangulata]|uniref:uncharacterized protein n=1 Tax=Aegilops tauschii subsp. strangulata TaxID=200361 RepID=UPI003CC83A89